MRGRLLLVLGAVAVLAVGSLAAIQWLPISTADQNAVTPVKPVATGPREAPAQVAALGRLEPTGSVINVAGTQGDRLARLNVAVGDTVAAGDELAVLESHALRKSERDYAQTQLEEATHRREVERAYGDSLVQEAEVGLEQLALVANDIAAQQAQVNVLEANRRLAAQDYQRLSALDEEITAPQQLEQAQLRVEQAEAELEAARKALEKLEASVPLQRRQAEAKLAAAQATRDRAVAAVPVESAQRNVEMADERLKLTVIRAPAAGRILEIYTHAGEAIGGQPVLKMADTSQMIAVAEVYETDVQFVRQGQPATVRSAALGDKKLTGVVERVGSMVGKNQQLSLDPTKSADLRVVEVRIKLDDSAAAAQMIQLQVTVTIDTSQQPDGDDSTARAPVRPAVSR